MERILEGTQSYIYSLTEKMTSDVLIWLLGRLCWWIVFTLYVVVLTLVISFFLLWSIYAMSEEWDAQINITKTFKK